MIFCDENIPPNDIGLEQHVEFYHKHTWQSSNHEKIPCLVPFQEPTSTETTLHRLYVICMSFDFISYVHHAHPKVGCIKSFNCHH